MLEHDNEVELKFNGCFEQDIVVKKAGKYEVKLKQGVDFNSFALFVSGLIDIIDSYILVNNFSTKEEAFAKKYIQQNSLFISSKMFLVNALNLYEYSEAISLMYGGYNLANAAISSFCMKDLITEKVASLSQQQKQLLYLSNTIACPSLIWLIHRSVLSNLQEDDMAIFENTLKTRIKHGGVCIIVE